MDLQLQKVLWCCSRIWCKIWIIWTWLQRHGCCPRRCDSASCFMAFFRLIVQISRYLSYQNHIPSSLPCNPGVVPRWYEHVRRFRGFSNHWFRAVEILKVSTLYDELQVYYRGESSVCEGSLRGHVSVFVYRGSEMRSRRGENLKPKPSLFRGHFPASSLRAWRILSGQQETSIRTTMIGPVLPPFSLQASYYCYSLIE